MKPLSIVVHEDAMVPLDRWLATELSRALGRPVPRGLTRKGVLAGVVAVGGRIVRDPGLMLRHGRSVFVSDLGWLPKMQASSDLRVLHEDDGIIAVDKPAGLPTHETKDPDRKALTQLVEAHVGRRVFLHHRLDEGTSGVIVFAKAAAANAGLARSFADRKVHKTYVALVARPPIDWPSDLSINTPILVADNGSVSTDLAGVPAITRIRVIGRGERHLLIEAIPVTGRKHQIRTHLASVGAPIIGDKRYGGVASKSGRLMLHAERLEFDHPLTGRPLRLLSPRPKEFRVMRDETAETASRAKVSLGLGARPRRLEAGSARGESGPRLSQVADPKKKTSSHKEMARRRPVRAGARGSRH